MTGLKVTDNDADEISVTDEGLNIRSWTYGTEAERRTKMLCAREFVEGYYHAAHRALPALVETTHLVNEYSCRTDVGHIATDCETVVRRAQAIIAAFQ